jgi:cyclohexanone monooxygenase
MSIQRCQHACTARKAVYVAAPTDLPFDPDALRHKYEDERNKRLRADGNAQYLEVAGSYARYVKDPYATSAVNRSLLTDEVDVICVGGGYGGLLAGAHLREAGIERIRIIDKGADLGGTWYWNQYPGAQCDIEAYVYMPLLEQLGYVPAEKYARAPEIMEHTRAIARHYNLLDDAVLQTEVTELRWDELSARWIVSTNRGDEMRARFIVIASGPLHRPKIPGVSHRSGMPTVWSEWRWVRKSLLASLMGTPVSERR